MRSLRALALLLTLILCRAPAVRLAHAQTSGWRDTPFTLVSTGDGDRYAWLNYTCWDPVTLGQLLVAENGVGIMRYDLHASTRAPSCSLAASTAMVAVSRSGSTGARSRVRSRFHYPISDEFVEVNPENGRPYTMQYNGDRALCQWRITFELARR